VTLLAAVPYRTFPDFQLGPLTIRTFGLMVALGIIVGAMIGARYVANRGVDPDEYTNIATRAAIVGLVGARLTWVLSHLDQIQSPLDVIAVWEGGVQFSGGLLFGALAGWLSARNRYTRTQGWALVDGSALGLAVGLAIGRIGCMAVGEHFGGETSFFLGMTYQGGGTVEAEPAIGATIHNTAFYEFLHLAVLVAVMALLLRRAGNRRAPLVPGTIGALMLVWYGIGRFATDFTRVNDATAAGLTGAQWAAVVMVLLGVYLFATGSKRARALAASEVPDEARRPEQSTIKVIPPDTTTDDATAATATPEPDPDHGTGPSDDPPVRADDQAAPATPDPAREAHDPPSHVKVTHPDAGSATASEGTDLDDGPLDEVDPRDEPAPAPIEPTDAGEAVTGDVGDRGGHTAIDHRDDATVDQPAADDEPDPAPDGHDPAHDASGPNEHDSDDDATADDVDQVPDDTGTPAVRTD